MVGEVSKGAVCDRFGSREIDAPQSLRHYIINGECDRPESS